jgi:hypothetical protein
MCVVMEEITGEPRAMWGMSIIGFGTYHYRYRDHFVMHGGGQRDTPAAGADVDWPSSGFDHAPAECDPQIRASVLTCSARAFQRGPL